jgi:hypothetical protein
VSSDHQPPQRLGLEGATSKPDVASRSSSATFHAPTPPAHAQATTLRRERHRVAAACRLVEATPALDDLAVPNPEDVDARQRAHGLRRRKSEDRTLLRARRREPLDDDVVLDVEAQLAVPVSNASRIMAVMARQPSTVPVPPNGGRWST